MKALWGWVGEFVDVEGVSAEEAASRLTMAGVEVEGVEVLPWGETLWEVNLTANRGDCLSMRGLARELSVVLGRPFRDVAVEVSWEASLSGPSVVVEEPEFCPRYTAVVVEGVEVGRSAEAVVRRLEACGVRSINSVVDATNYVMLETGHPLHAFDLDRLAGGRVVVRRAREGEVLRTLDGVERRLTAGDLVIADAERAVALAGVMGGAESEIREGTRRILLESAYFDPVTVRRTARRQGLHTEASHRFERGTDPEEAPRSLLRVVRMILAACPSAKVSAVADVYPRPVVRRPIRYRNGRYARLVGVPVAFGEACGILGRLGCRLEGRDDGAEEVTVVPPSYRHDLEREVDLIEEVCRLTGYDRVPAELPSRPAVASSEFGEFRGVTEAAWVVRRILTAAGLDEAVNYGFESSAFNDLLGMPAEGRLRLRNPLDANQDMMRVSLLPGLLGCLLRNARYLQTDLGLFEVGKVFSVGGEEERAAVLLSGRKVAKGPFREAVDWDWYDLKGLVEAVCGGFGDGVEVEFRRAERPWFHKGRCAEVVHGGEVVGVLGMLSPRLQERLELRQAVYLAEWSMGFLVAAGRRRPGAGQLSKFLPVRRDLSLLCDAETDFAELTAFLASWPGVVAVRMTDVYQGERTGEGKLSVTFTLRIGQDGTMTDERINGVVEGLLKALGERYGIGLA